MEIACRNMKGINSHFIYFFESVCQILYYYQSPQEHQSPSPSPCKIKKVTHHHRRTRLLLENKKQNKFAFENNLEFTRIPRIYEGL